MTPSPGPSQTVANAASREFRFVIAPLILTGIVAAGCSQDDQGNASMAASSSTTASSSPTGSGEGSPSPTGAETLFGEAFADTITTCERLLLTPRQVSDVLGVRVQAPAPFKAAGVVFGCEYATPNKAQGGGQLVIDASTTENPPSPLSSPTKRIRGVGDEAAFNPQPGATTILRVRSGELILDLSVGGVLLYGQFGGQDAMAGPLVELANQALLNLEE